jgi:integrase
VISQHPMMSDLHFMQPKNNNGSIIIRFSRCEYKYSLTKLGLFCDAVRVAKANEICTIIENDIKLGRFTAKDNDELFTAYHPMAVLYSYHENNLSQPDAKDLVLAKIAISKVKERVLLPVSVLMVKYDKPIKSPNDALKFWLWMSNDSKRSNNSNNLYLATIKPICPMFKGIKPLKNTAIAKAEKPFTKDEIREICKVIDRDFSHYSLFVKFLFSTGCRTSEAIALTWQNVDFEAKTITISESIGIAADGSKVRKDTKTGVARVIPMSANIFDLLKAHDKAMVRREFQGHIVHEVFPSPNGSLIDIGNFRARVWVKALEAAKVPYRTCYNTRHTFCSHFLNETPDFIKLASITHGTKSGVQTLIKHYAHLVSDISMPDMF